MQLVDSKSKHLSDKVLIEMLMQQQIEPAVNALYTYHFKDLVHYIELQGGAYDDGADLFQESILVLINKIRDGAFKGDSSIKTFLYGICKNKWLTEQRTRMRRRAREMYYATSEDVIVQADIEQDEQPTIPLHKMLEQIGEACQKILLGFYFEKKSMRELLQELTFKNEQVLRNKKALCMKKLKSLVTQNSQTLATIKTL